MRACRHRIGNELQLLDRQNERLFLTELFPDEAQLQRRDAGARGL